MKNYLNIINYEEIIPNIVHILADYEVYKRISEMVRVFLRLDHDNTIY